MGCELNGELEPVWPADEKDNKLATVTNLSILPSDPPGGTGRSMCPFEKVKNGRMKSEFDNHLRAKRERDELNANVAEAKEEAVRLQREKQHNVINFRLN